MTKTSLLTVLATCAVVMLVVAGCALTGPEVNGAADSEVSSDHSIRADILQAIRDNPAINSFTINVHFGNGVATLSGYTDALIERSLAVNSAKRVNGVDRVINLITVDDR